jgi:hypothetical protein
MKQLGNTLFHFWSSTKPIPSTTEVTPPPPVHNTVQEVFEGSATVSLGMWLFNMLIVEIPYTICFSE